MGESVRLLYNYDQLNLIESDESTPLCENIFVLFTAGYRLLHEPCDGDCARILNLYITHRGICRQAFHMNKVTEQ